MNPVNWFEIPVSDMDRAKKFYETVLGHKIDIQEMGEMVMGWFPMEWEVTGSSGTLVKMESYVPSHNGSMVYFTVADIDDVLQKAEVNGGKILNPKKDIGEYGWIGHFEDSEGNRVGVHTAKPQSETEDK